MSDFKVHGVNCKSCDSSREFCVIYPKKKKCYELRVPNKKLSRKSDKVQGAVDFKIPKYKCYMFHIRFFLRCILFLGP